MTNDLTSCLQHLLPKKFKPTKIDHELGKGKNFCEHPLQTIENKGKIKAGG